MGRRETLQDARNEQRIINIVQMVRGVQFERANENDPYGVYKNAKLVALSTATHRNKSWLQLDEYGGVFFEIRRHERWKPLIAMCNVPLTFVVEALTDIRYCVIDGVNHDGIVEDGGRRDRGDPDDVQPCYKLLSKRFIRI